MTRPGRRAAAVSLLACLLVAGCGRGQDPAIDVTVPTTSADGSGSTPAGFTVGEALDADVDEVVAVHGFLVAPPGQPVRLCEAVAESYPPQCGGPSLRVEGLALDDVPGLTSSEPDAQGRRVRWSEQEVSLYGTIDDDTLTVDRTRR